MRVVDIYPHKYFQFLTSSAIFCQTECHIHKGIRQASVGGIGYLRGRGFCIEYLNMNVEYVM